MVKGNDHLKVLVEQWACPHHQNKPPYICR
nr:MAG TPA: hypothetical protein [Caudoviricetes sp.]